VPASRRAAWDAYLTLTNGLLPILDTDQAHARVSTALADVTERVECSAPLWGDHGPMLVAALKSATRLYRAEEHSDLRELLRIVADRLYLLSARRTRPRRDGSDPATN
jgi:hypothetical protein